MSRQFCRVMVVFVRAPDRHRKLPPRSTDLEEISIYLPEPFLHLWKCIILYGIEEFKNRQLLAPE